MFLFMWSRATILYLCAMLLLTLRPQAQPASLDSLFSLAKKQYQQNHFAEAITTFQQCLQAAQQQKDWLRTGNAFNSIGIAQDRSGNYEEALQQYFQAIRMYERAGNDEKRAGSLKNIGNVYRVLKNFDRSQAYLQASFDIRKKIRDSVGLASVLNDLGILYMDKDSNAKAISFFKQVIREYRRHAIKEVQAYALNNLASCYGKLRQYNEAEAYYMASLQAMQQANNRYGVAMVQVNLGYLYNQQKEYEKAIAYIEQGAALAAELGAKELLLNAYEQLAKAYEGMFDYKQSSQFLRKQLDVKDSIFKEETARSISEMETRFQTERKQKEILLLQQQALIKNAALESQQRTKYFLILVLVLIGLVAVLLLRTALLRKRSNQRLALLNNKLEEANTSKVKLLSILSHDLRSPISNLFSFLHLKAGQTAALSASEQQAHDKKITAAAENLLEAMEDVLIWTKSQMEHFTPVVEPLSVSLFFDEIMTLNAAAAANKNITLEKECAPGLSLQIDPNFLKIIVRNLLSNAIKFTPGGGWVRLAAITQANRVLITISDNGPGLAPEDQHTLFDWTSIRSDSSGLGLKLAKEFTEKLGGAITVQSQVQQGTSFLLSFPATTFSNAHRHVMEN